MNHHTALVQRLCILRYVYGLSPKVNLLKEQLNVLWNLCGTSEDREDLMVFLADASNDESGSVPIPSSVVSSRTHQSQIGPSPKQLLTSSISEDAQEHAFQNLFCSNGVN